MARRKRVAPPPDDPRWQNQSKFRIAERFFKRAKRVSSSPLLLEPPSASLTPIVLPIRSAGSQVEPDLDPRLTRVSLAKPLSSLLPQHFADGDQSPAEAFTVSSIPGLVLIANPFTEESQRTLVRACLQDYAKPPNVTNLDTHYVLPESGLWSIYEDFVTHDRSLDDPSMMVALRSGDPVTRPGYGDDMDGQEHGHDLGQGSADSMNSVDSIGPEHPTEQDTADAIQIDPPTSQTPLLKSLSVEAAVRKLRWASLGLQYNWSVKEYHMDRQPPFPALIADLCQAIVTAAEPLTGYASDRFRCEAGIVNYYHYKDALMAHQDRSELNTEAPLVSLSLGHSCILLMGTPDRNDEPTPIVLQSGDIVVMSGPCRLAFHGVPRIIEDTLPEYLARRDDGTDDEWKPFGEFLSQARINVNVRQVHPA
ncbi:uncharacterized protein BJ171DRAFT_522715 [Polychytrium aggregatum]|uniref:uncharacterized protein n=1 Tax=Polychytrium aggregatum TaxID=110093 RepID=UPI0022FE3F41|nr:uncharacterized protein BJ171DRAFT_522715 [Polychytrium aggregatum]KAI9197116.1 hypothetical protein BJ171DRAFT_522715 [Polychytrium aggregatum]